MKKMIVLAALVFSAAGIRAQELLPDNLPGLSDDQGGIQRPDAKRIMSELSPALRLSSKQEDRVSEAITKKSKEFDKLLKEYDKASSEEKNWREKVAALKVKMNKINKSLPDVIRGYLDDEQSQNLDNMLEAKKNKGGAEVKKNEAPDGAAAPVKKKKKLVRKKKRPAAEPPAEEAAPAPAPEKAAAAAPAAEEEPGTTMVDNEPAPPPAARKKKKILKKKVKAEPPAEDAIEETPAGATGTGKEAPAEAPAEEDAGTYP